MDIQPEFIDKITGGAKWTFVSALFLIEGDHWNIIKINLLFVNILYLYVLLNGVAGASLIYRHLQESRSHGQKCPECGLTLEGRIKYKCPTHGELFKE